MTSKENAFKDRDARITTKFLDIVQNILANSLRQFTKTKNIYMKCYLQQSQLPTKNIGEPTKNY